MLFERGRDDLDVERALQVRDGFGPLVDQQHDHVRVRLVRFDRARDAHEQRGVVGARRREQQRALAFAERREQIEPARREIAARLEREALRRRFGAEVFEDRAGWRASRAGGR